MGDVLNEEIIGKWLIEFDDQSSVRTVFHLHEEESEVTNRYYRCDPKKTKKKDTGAVFCIRCKEACPTGIFMYMQTKGITL